MRAEVRHKVGMGESVSDFCHAHPFDNALYNEALAGVDAAIADAKAKHGEYLAGVGGQVTSTATLDHFRDWIRMQFRQVVRVSAAIARKDVGFNRQFRLPKPRAADLKFLATLRAMTQAGEEHQAAFARYGIAPEWFAAMRKELDRFEELLHERRASQSDHVGAHAVLDDVLAALMGHVDDLDALNTVRFAGNPELMAAWKSVSKLPARRRAARSEAGKEASR